MSSVVSSPTSSQEIIDNGDSVVSLGQPSATFIDSRATGTETIVEDAPKPEMKDEEMTEVEDEGCDDEISCALVAKFGKDRIVLTDLAPSTTILEVKSLLQIQTRVLPMRQKLIGLNLQTKMSKARVSDETALLELYPKPRKQTPASLSLPEGALYFECILMGTPEEAIFVDPAKRDDLPDVVDDFDLDFTAGSEQWERHVANKDKLKESICNTKIHVMNEPRPNYPLLVLDLDHTLLDFSSKDLRESLTQDHALLHAQIMKRPFMDEFLRKMYLQYDLVVWSQTSWRWLETKLIELGMLTDVGYRFTFVLDKTSMFAITSTKKNSGEHYRHHVKPLELIWTKFPLNYSQRNTVHVDDLARNFALNMENGLRVKPYFRKKVNKRSRDVELEALSIYLSRLAKEAPNQFDLVDFGVWQDVVTGTKDLLIKPSTYRSSKSLGFKDNFTDEEKKP